MTTELCFTGYHGELITIPRILKTMTTADFEPGLTTLEHAILFAGGSSSLMALAMPDVSCKFNFLLITPYPVNVPEARMESISQMSLCFKSKETPLLTPLKLAPSHMGVQKRLWYDHLPNIQMILHTFDSQYRGTENCQAYSTLESTSKAHIISSHMLILSLGFATRRLRSLRIRD